MAKTRSKEHVQSSKRTEVGAGEAAVAPRVDDPLGFAVHNVGADRILVTFTYDPASHIQTAHVALAKAPKTLPDETGTSSTVGNMPAGTA